MLDGTMSTRGRQLAGYWGMMLVLAGAGWGMWAAEGGAGGRGMEPSGEYLRDWLVCGPFPLLGEGGGEVEAIRQPGMYRDYLVSAGGEGAVRPREGEVVLFERSRAVWKAHRSEGAAVDLDAAVSRADQVVAYAYGEVESEREQVCVLAVGSNDGARVWLNGELVVEVPGPRGLKMDHNVVPVALRAGRNRLLVKVEERGNRWGFAVRLLRLGRDVPAERLRLFEVAQRADGGAAIRARQSERVTRALVESARFEVFRPSAPERVVWGGDWEAGKELEIGVDAGRFAEYRLRIRSGLRGVGTQELVVPFTVGERVERVLFEGGRTEYRVVLSREASESERWAAGELQRALREIGGVTMEVVSEDAAGLGEKVVLVGWSSRVRELVGSEEEAPADGDESFAYRSVGSAVAIWGGRQRGTMYGVMSLLERELGVRFYTPRVTVVPKRERLAFGHWEHRERPGVRVRNDFYFEAFDPIWAARNRINGAMSHRAQPGGVECYWSVHTFYPLMPPEEFFGAHPEYYSLINGVRTADRAQLCVTHPDVVRILTERLRQKMRELPEYLIYDLSQNDWANPCECAGCQAVVDREGSQSGPVIALVNQVADAVRGEFPGKFVGTLAYQYTRKPPRTLRPRDNVVVRLCSIECCFAHDFRGCPENRSFVEDMEGWAAVAPHLYIWDYVVNFSHYVMPYPNFGVLRSNIQFFRDHRAIGIMEQAAYQSRGGEFAELRAYVLAKLLWDPEAAVEPIVDDFMYGYYGRAGQQVRAYFDLLHDRVTPETHIHLGLQPDDKLFSDEFVREAEGLFDRAEAVAETEEIRRRVELARLPVMYLKCKREPGLARRDGTYARFCEIARREGVTHYAEAGEPHRKAFHAEVEEAR